MPSPFGEKALGIINISLGNGITTTVKEALSVQPMADIASILYKVVVSAVIFCTSAVGFVNKE